MARTIFVLLLVVHAAIHGIGVARAFGWAAPTAAAVPNRLSGILWLSAAALLVLAAGLVATRSRGFPVVAGSGVLLSQVAISTAFREAWAGTLANALIAAVVVGAAVGAARTSFRDEYDRAVAQRLSRPPASLPITDADVARLPDPIRKYLGRVGVVGKPRVQSYSARFVAKLRQGKGAPWLDLDVRQTNFADPATRLFYATTEMYGLPVEVFHEYVGSHATMRVRVASLFDLIDAKGPEMDQAETVTLFNDMCVLAPATLPFADVDYRVRDERHVDAVFRNAGHAIAAELVFDEASDLVGFVSNDRYESADGKSFAKYPWSTPLGGYRTFHGARVASHGTAIWKEPGGDFTYGQFELTELAYNAAPPGRQP